MQYKFSVIIPIYNVEEYLEEAILSIINQTINFKDNIQIILVNDGSPDNSEKICLKYKNKYPDNIIYINQENNGVSAARNHGLKYAQGEYINFLDSDDKWPEDAFEKAYNFFIKHTNINVVACELEYFEAKTGCAHPLNFKFDKDKIIDIKYDSEFIQMHMASCFIRKNAIKDLFNISLKFGEDALFINKIILNDNCYGVMNSVHYLYRKRINETSAIDTCQLKKDFYYSTLLNLHQNLIDYSIEKYDKILPYIQYILMYDLQWRIKRQIPEGILDITEQKQYINKIKDILFNIDDYIIMKQRDISLEHKIYALNLKYNYDITTNLVQIKKDFFYNNLFIFSAKNKAFLRLSEISIKNNLLHIEGIINTAINKQDYKIIISDQNLKHYQVILVDYKKQEKYNLEGHYYYNQYFKIDIPLTGDILKIKFLLQYKDNSIIALDVGNTNTCKLNTSVKNGYLKLQNNIIEYKNNKLVVRNNSKKLHFKLENKYNKMLFNQNYRKLVFLRWIRFVMYYFITKEIWLISDRPDKAGDNGEAFFKYLQSVNNKKIKPYFVIEKTSVDYNRMKKIGKVINYNSLKYKILFILASKIISSQASEYILNPFGKNYKYMKDICIGDFVFLQHGVIKDDLSNWLNKQSKKIDLFVTSGIPEYNSIINGDYYYDENVVKLTGLPRHDNLIQMNQKSKQIAIVPTWRQSIPNCIDKTTDKSIYNKDFKDTAFFDFYNSLINNDNLINVMKQYGYTGVFCLHPLFKEQYVHFTENDVIKVNKGYVDYQKLFSENDLLITDYSSVFFDFAYLNKPIVYCHFDKQDFFEGHSYNEGYFSYEDDAFGPVSYNIKETIDNIIEIIKNDCQLSEKYKERIDKFYPSNKGNNCQRLYNEIINM